MRLNPRMKPPAAATPVAALTTIRNVMTAICEKFDRLLSPAYACQFVFVMNDAAVLNARSGLCDARCSASNGSVSWMRSSR